MACLVDYSYCFFIHWPKCFYFCYFNVNRCWFWLACLVRFSYIGQKKFNLYITLKLTPMTIKASSFYLCFLGNLNLQWIKQKFSSFGIFNLNEFFGKLNLFVKIYIWMETIILEATMSLSNNLILVVGRSYKSILCWVYPENHKLLKFSEIDVLT